MINQNIVVIKKIRYDKLDNIMLSYLKFNMEIIIQ